MSAPFAAASVMCLIGGSSMVQAASRGLMDTFFKARRAPTMGIRICASVPVGRWGEGSRSHSSAHGAHALNTYTVILVLRISCFPRARTTNRHLICTVCDWAWITNLVSPRQSQPQRVATHLLDG